jgi:serine/threonine protein kinase
MSAPNTADEFLDLVQKSGLADAARLQEHLDHLRVSASLPREPEKFADLLVRDAFLTLLQAEQLLLGKWRGFSIGPYKLLERLGAGLHASVYLCEDAALHRRIAVKVLPISLANDYLSLRRFHRECQILASLHHPNIVAAYEGGQADTVTYLSMEYVDGSSLEAIVEKCGPMDVTRTAHYFRQAALGLQYLYERGIVHRDIKPADILVDRTGIVKIIDMGLVRAVVDVNEMRLDKYHGEILGTPDYISPEQTIDPRTVDTRADIYSLGATFYFCLAGHSPFGKGTVAQKVLWHQTRRPKPIRLLRRDVPKELEGLIENMMAKDPAQRPQTPQEVADALAPFTTQPIAPPPENEMPRLSPAASGGQASRSG